MRGIKGFFLFLIASLPAFALNMEHVLWDKTPIAIPLSLQEERLIRFPQSLRIIESEAGALLSILKVQESVYLKPKGEFKNKRLIVQLMPQGEVIVLSLSSDKKNNVTSALAIMLEREEEKRQSEKPKADINAINLTRFAIQSLYSPQRLLTIPEGINRTPMQTRKHITLFYGASLDARPLISWHGGDLYITAVALKNHLNKEIIIDPRHMLGNWQTATFFPTNTLKGRGLEDTTTVFLVSDKPFNEALESKGGFVR